MEPWNARRFNFKRNVWETRSITAGVGCREMLRSLSEERPRTFGMGRARGTSTWRIRGVGGGSTGGLEADTSATGGWEVAAPKSIAHLDLELEHHRWFGGARQRPHHNTAICFNIWDGAPAEGTGGHRTIRGGAVCDAADDGGIGWCLAAPAPLGTDIELYATPEASRDRRPEGGGCTLGMWRVS